ncbi:MAG: hypothetical protein KatS3mg060_2843 [Dehalococcoidia bacterium]|nr:MAG: hypothetical protein KatS3mg060_2843 [Dehalococcoidia bacterium]
MPALILAIGLSAVAAVPLLHPGYFHNHAGLLPAYQAISGGPFGWSARGAMPPLPPLPHVVLALLQSTWIEPATALKLLHGAALLLGPASAFFAGAAIWRLARPDRAGHDWQGGLLASVLYAFVPYRLAATYVRGDLGDACALALAPWLVALALGAARPLPLGAIALAMALSNPTLAVGGAAGALALRAIAKRTVTVPTLVVTGGLALSFVAWLPVWFGPLPAVAPDPVQPAQLILARWGYDSSPAAGLPIQLGAVAVGAAGIAIVGAERRWFLFALGGLSLAPAILSLAGPLWTPLVTVAGQPWQLLGLTALGLALVGVLLPLPHGREAAATVFALALVAMAASYSFLQPIVLSALPRGEPVLAAFGERVALLAVHRGALSDAHFLALDWQAIADGIEDYRIVLTVRSSDGHVVAQHEQTPLDGRRPTAGWVKGEVIQDRLPLPDNLAAGRYHLSVSLVRARNGDRLPIRTREGTTTDELPLGEVSIR